MAHELKPCPMCGGDAEAFEHSWVGHGVACDGPDLSCTAEVAHYSSKAEAIAAWNRRANPAAALLEEAVKALEPFAAFLDADNMKPGAAVRDCFTRGQFERTRATIAKIKGDA